MWFLVLQLVTMKVIPQVCYEPCTITVQVRVKPQADNRKVEVTVDGEQYHHSEHDLEGDKAPFLHVFEFKNLTEGEYTVKTLLTGVGAKERSGAGQGLKVLSNRNVKGKKEPK